MNPTTALDRDRLAARVTALRSAFAEQLKQLVEVPSVSAQSRYKDEIKRCADVAAQLIRDAGGSAEVVATAGNPIVVGDDRRPTMARRGLPSTTTSTSSPPKRARTAGRARRSPSPKRAGAISRAARPTTRARRSPRCSRPRSRARRACRSTCAWCGSSRRRSARRRSKASSPRTAGATNPTPCWSRTRSGSRTASPRCRTPCADWRVRCSSCAPRRRTRIRDWPAARRAIR